MSKKTFNLITMVVAAIVAMTAQTPASLLVYEGFDYSDDGTTIIGQTSGAGRIGFAATNVWTSGDTLADTVNFNSSSGSLGYGSLQTSGGSLDIFRTTGTGTAKSAALNTSTAYTTSPNELFFSMVVNGDDLTMASGDYVEFVWNYSVTFSTARHFGIAFNGSTEIQTIEGKSALGAVNNPGTATGLSLASGNNLLVFRVTDKTAGSNDEFQMWLNPTDLSNLGTADYSTTTTLGLVANDARFGFSSLKASQGLSADSLLIDEFRLGTTVGDVLPIPEPATLGLFAAAGVGILFIRRRVMMSEN